MPHLSVLSSEQFSLLLATIQSYGDEPSSMTREQAAALFPKPPVVNHPLPAASIPDQFPTIKPAALLNICRHSFDPYDLYTLDPQYSRRVSGGDYPAFGTLFRPLARYFQVLIAFAGTSGDAAVVSWVASGMMEYLSHLVKLDELYRWPAVLAYHMEFHRKRIMEMARGEYGAWADIDGGLHAEYLFGKEKARGDDAHSGSGRRRGRRGKGASKRRDE